MDHNALLGGYLAELNELAAGIDGMTSAQVKARPIAGKWSVLEVVCHLADTEANIAYRIKRVLAEDRPQFERVQPDRMLEALAYHGRDIQEELAIIDLTRKQIGRILRDSPSEVWERTGIVKERGAKTVAQMVQGAIDHVRHHLRFIVEKRQAMGLGSAEIKGPT